MEATKLGKCTLGGNRFRKTTIACENSVQPKDNLDVILRNLDELDHLGNLQKLNLKRYLIWELLMLLHC